MIKMILNSLSKEIMDALDTRKEGSVDVRMIYQLYSGQISNNIRR